jgi:ArsR family transcriptional regulator
MQPHKGDGNSKIDETIKKFAERQRAANRGVDKKKTLLYSYMLNYAYSKARTTIRDVLKVFKALSDETRLRILSLVLERECSVCEIVQAMQISQTRASRNLGILQYAGLLKARRDGLWVLYSVDEESVDKKSCDGLDEVIRTAMENDEVAALDRERLKTAVREGPCSKWVFS